MRAIAINPIVGKELKETLRNRRVIGLALAYVVILSLLVLAMWPASGMNPAGGLRGRLIFSTLITAQLAMLVFFVPAFAANAITAERAGRTYETLLCTRLGAPAIVTGKLAGAAGFALMLVLLSLPAGAMSLVLGGVGLGEFFLAHAILLTAGVMFGLVGIACSALMRSAFRALVTAYVVMLVVCGAVNLPRLLLEPRVAHNAAWVRTLQSASPFTAVFAVTHRIFSTAGPNADARAVAGFFVLAAVAGAACVLLAVLGASRCVARPPRHRAAIDKKTALWVRLLRRILYVIDPRRRRWPIPPFVNPVLVMEMRVRTAGLTTMLRVLGGCIIFSLGLVLVLSSAVGPQTLDTVRLLALAIQFGLIVLLAPTLTVGSISSEIENRTLDLLRMTPTGPVRVLAGKLGAALFYALMLLVAVTPVFLALMHIREIWDPEVLRAVLSVAGSTILLAVAAGLFFSSVCRRTGTAAALTYGLMGLLVAATGLAAVLGDRLHAGLARFVLSLNPIVCTVSLFTGKLFANYDDLWRQNVMILCLLSGLALIGALIRLTRLMEPER